MAVAMALTVAQTLFAALQCAELRELSSMLGYKSKLEELKGSVITIKAVLLDADSKHQELTEAGRNWIEKLKDAVYDADDLFDELTTKAQQLNGMPGGKLSQKVRRFFSNDNQLLFAFNKSREIKKLKGKLDKIADDRGKFGFSDEYKPVKRRDETCSYVYETTIIGREKEKESIVKMLLSGSPCVSISQNVSFVSIVGMGGLGKTTLAQLVFNDGRTKEAFGENLYWVCVSEEFGLKEILSKFAGTHSERTLQEIQEEVLRRIRGKKYLLVLDDVWEENKHKWLELTSILGSGGAGSRILVTTRSKKVAMAVGKGVVYELEGLSEELSWELFKQIAFEEGDDHDDTHLIEIGKDIVKKCANVPLSIRVVSSLLHGLEKSRWEECRNMDLANMTCYDREDSIMSTLMFSYYNLTPELKSCFSFCSLFPKDYVLNKEELISLWMAEGYLAPRHERDSMEDVGEEYFWILLQRCFFQDVQRDEYGEIYSCKMHDLMHDLSLKVAGKESLMLTTSRPFDLERDIRHLSITITDATVKYSSQTLRTYLWLHRHSSVDVAAMVLTCRRLRVLLLKCWIISSLPDEIGKLSHLRYLELSGYDLEMLPKSITNLYNLQLLKLCNCDALTELPRDIGKLINLRMLDISECYGLKELPEGIVELANLRMLKMGEQPAGPYEDNLCTIEYMPVGMDKLTNLHTLTHFVVGNNSRAMLTDLKGLLYLRGHLSIQVGYFSPSNKPNATKGANILKKAHLKSLDIYCDTMDGQGEYQETLLEGLCPNSDYLRTLYMRSYQGLEFPNWGSGTVSFPTGIVKIHLSNCCKLKHLSSMSKLINLKSLMIDFMDDLEYIEMDAPSNTPETFFPSLEELVLYYLRNLKGWWRDVTWKEKEAGWGGGRLEYANGSCVKLLLSFPHLRTLEISDCQSLKYFPPCPQLKNLKLDRVNASLNFCINRSTYFHLSNPTLEYLETDEGEVFNSLFRESFLGCAEIPIYDCEKDVWEGTQRCSSVQQRSFESCHFLSLSGGGIGYLTKLQSLKIESCEFLETLGEDDDKEGMLWKSLESLSSLELRNLRRLVKLPNGLQYLTSLQSLNITNCHDLELEGIPWKSFVSLSSLVIEGNSKLVNFSEDFNIPSLQSLKIVDCDNLEELRECVGSLTSLRSLQIVNCSKLKSLPEAMLHLTSLTKLRLVKPSTELQERCQEPDGEDCFKIRHIPNFTISDFKF